MKRPTIFGNPHVAKWNHISPTNRFHWYFEGLKPTFDQHGSFSGVHEMQPFSSQKAKGKKWGCQSFSSSQLSRLDIGHHVSSIIENPIWRNCNFQDLCRCLGAWFTTCSSKCVNFFPKVWGERSKNCLKTPPKFRQYYGISQVKMLKTEPKKGLV